MAEKTPQEVSLSVRLAQAAIRAGEKHNEPSMVRKGKAIMERENKADRNASDSKPQYPMGMKVLGKAANNF